MRKILEVKEYFYLDPDEFTQFLDSNLERYVIVLKNSGFSKDHIDSIKLTYYCGIINFRDFVTTIFKHLELSEMSYDKIISQISYDKIISQMNIDEQWEKLKVNVGIANMQKDQLYYNNKVSFMLSVKSITTLLNPTNLDKTIEFVQFLEDYFNEKKEREQI